MDVRKINIWAEEEDKGRLPASRPRARRVKRDPEESEWKPKQTRIPKMTAEMVRKLPPVAKALHTGRENMGLSPDEFAALAGIGSRKLAEIEMGKREANDRDREILEICLGLERGSLSIRRTKQC